MLGLLVLAVADFAFSAPCTETSSVNLLVLCPFDSDVRIGATTASAALVALKTIKERRILPETFDLKIRYADSKCSSVDTLKSILEAWEGSENPLDAVVGPVCSGACSAGADFLQIKNYPMISWDCTQPDLSNKPNFLRTVSDYGKFSSVITAFMSHYNLTRIVMICSVETIWITTCESIKSRIAAESAQGSNVKVTEIIPLLIPDEDTDEFSTAAELVFREKIMPKARVVFLACYIGAIRKIMAKAGALNMLDGYLYFGMESSLVDLGEQYSPYTADSSGVTSSMIKGDIAKQELSVLQGLVSFNFGIASTNKAFQQFREAVFQNRLKVLVDGEKVMETATQSAEDVDSLAVTLHDAVLLYAIGLNKSITAGVEECRVVKKDISDIEFEGIINQIHIDERGDVVNPDTLVLNFQESLSGSYQLQEVGEVTNSTFKAVAGSRIVWPGNRYDNINDCGDYNELCPAEDKGWVTMIVVVVILVILMITGAIFAAIWFRKKKIQLTTAWKIAYNDLNFEVDRAGNAIGSTIIGSRLIGSKTESLVSQPMDGPDNISGIKRATYKRQAVAVKFLKRNNLTVSNSFMKQMNMLREMEHGNIVKFYGICVQPNKVCTIFAYCPKGSLQDILQNEKLNLDVMFQQSFITDIIKGLEYIHKSNLYFHGNLSSQNTLIDGHWVLKLTKFGLQTLREKSEKEEMQKTYDDYDDEMINVIKRKRAKLWAPPEHTDTPLQGSQKGDIYRFAIICSEILTREDPFAMHELELDEIIKRVKEQQDPPFRPLVKDTVLGDVDLWDLINMCWSENPENRPDIGKVKVMTRKLTNRQKSLTDRMMLMMEKYTNHLEELVDEKTAQLQVEKLKADKLLYRMLPMRVAEKLKKGEAVMAEWFDDVTIYFSDIVGFTNICSQSDPLQVVDFLNDLYTCFDGVIDSYDVYKVETIGDAYMVVSGLPNKNGSKHSSEIADMALDLLDHIKTFKIRHKPDVKCALRIGLHTGPCCAGVVGLAMPRYCLFGDTVNMASRMESNGIALKIHISPETYEALNARGTHILEPRGAMEIKGKGEIFTYWVTGKVEKKATVTVLPPSRLSGGEELFTPLQVNRDDMFSPNGDISEIV